MYIVLVYNEYILHRIHPMLNDTQHIHCKRSSTFSSGTKKRTSVTIKLINTLHEVEHHYITNSKPTNNSEINRKNIDSIARISYNRIINDMIR